MSGKGKRNNSKKTKTPQSKSKRAGLQFPVGRITRYLRKGRYASRISQNGAVYLTAVLEYMVAEVLELAGNATRDLKLKTVMPRHITLAIRGDEDLDNYFKGNIAGGGVIPHIYKQLLPVKSKSNKKKKSTDKKKRKKKQSKKKQSKKK
mmetsp:Transcript_51228/g.100363  ORF Transcript_51228/g.100363 Transcript_51228/m.100363 type:complete len:149 (+) Transcript_51228:142-588(+)